MHRHPEAAAATAHMEGSVPGSQPCFSGRTESLYHRLTGSVASSSSAGQARKSEACCHPQVIKALSQSSACFCGLHEMQRANNKRQCKALHVIITGSDADPKGGPGQMMQVEAGIMTYVLHLSGFIALLIGLPESQQF